MISMTLKHSTRLTCATLAALITAVAADGTSCSSAEHNSTDSAAIFFQHAGASLMVATDDPPPSEHLVHVRERRNLVYSHRSEIPEFISSPTSAAFPLLVHADENATMMMTTAAEAADEEAAQRTATLEDYAHARARCSTSGSSRMAPWCSAACRSPTAKSTAPSSQR